MSANEAEDRKVEEIVIITAGVIGVLIGFVFYWYGTICLVEHCISDDEHQARTCKLCQWCHRQNQPRHEVSTRERPITVQDVEAVPVRIRKDRLIRALPLFHISTEELEEQRLEKGPQRKHGEVSNDQETMIQKRDDNMRSTINNSDCSICVQELKASDSVFITPHCHHLFHRNCIGEWMITQSGGDNIECPNCRSTIITRRALNRVYLGGQLEPENV
jgi:hypothetical protein